MENLKNDLDEFFKLNLVPLELKKYPFNGNSKNLIDRIYIIGYDDYTLKSLLYKNKLETFIDVDIQIFEEEKNEIQFLDFRLNEKPVILNDISNNYLKDVIDSDLMIDMIFPNKPKFFYNYTVTKPAPSLDKNNKNKGGLKVNNPKNEKLVNDEIKIIKIPKSYNVVFSSNPESNDNTKKSINGFCHICYKQFRKIQFYKNREYKFYVPFGICIISEYPFYSSFEKLTQQIFRLYLEIPIDIPIEIILQNIVSFASSPLNCDIYLHLNPFKFNQSNYSKVSISDIRKYNEEPANYSFVRKEFKNKKSGEISHESFSSNKLFTHTKSPTVSFENLSSTQLGEVKKKINVPKDLEDRVKEMSFSKTFVEKEIDIYEPIRFPKLNGYPLLQYNLAKVLLNKLKPQDLIIIFYYTLLEKDVILFCNDISLLSLTINSFYNLNFPFNDGKYYYVNSCISLENYINGNSLFSGTGFPSIVGIHHKYDESYKNNQKLNEHIAVDLDNGVLYEVYSNENLDEKPFFDYIKKICSAKETKDTKSEGFLLRNETRTLYEKLDSLNNKIQNESEYNTKILKNDYLSYIYNNNDNSGFTQSVNKQIQESFYRITIYLSLYFYKNLCIEYTDIEEKYQSSILSVEYKNKGNKELTKEELYFVNEFKDTIKFETFFNGYIKSNSCIDLYKIPLSISEEFMSIIAQKELYNLKNLKIFKPFIDLFRAINYFRFDIDFNPYLDQFYIKYKSKFKRAINDSKRNKMILRVDDNTIYYNTIELDNGLLFDYQRFLNELNMEEFNRISYIKSSLELNVVQKFRYYIIENLFEKMLIVENILDKNEICVYNIIYLFIIILNSLKYDSEPQSFLFIIFQNFTILRKYFRIIIELCFRSLKQCLITNDLLNAKKFLHCYIQCINSIKMKNIIPNENLTNSINLLNRKILDEIQNTLGKNNSIDNDNLNDNIINKKNDIINKNTVYICKNFTTTYFFKEKNIIETINEDDGPDRFEEKLFIKNQTIIKRICPQIRLVFKKDKILECDIYSQIKINSFLQDEYQYYIKDLDFKCLDIKKLLISFLNIAVYIRNTKEFENKDEINDFIQNAGSIIINKYLELKKK